VVAEHLLSGEGPVTLVTTFRVREGASVDRFVEIWTEVGRLMAHRRGFVSSRLYRAVVGGDGGEYIHVAEWTHAALLADARSDPEIRSVERELERLLNERRRVLYDAVTEPLEPEPAPGAY
jgi:heme-degrading monooxygenase HmoA